MGLMDGDLRRIIKIKKLKKDSCTRVVEWQYIWSGWDADYGAAEW